MIHPPNKVQEATEKKNHCKKNSGLFPASTEMDNISHTKSFLDLPITTALIICV